jgi:Holliday junction DNA helicase RuvA
MIGYVEGRLAEITENACLLITSGGVGYEIFLPVHMLAQLPARGERLCCYTATVVREDALELYGFPSWDERETFFVLTSISRVGAKTALAVLSVYRPDDLRRLVAEEDAVALTRVPGIGKKTGQQIFLELKYKLKGGDSILPALAAAGSQVLRDAVAGLANLGYDEAEAVAAVKKALRDEPDLDVPATLRAALKALAKGRV